jgi:hypothetical protein
LLIFFRKIKFRHYQVVLDNCLKNLKLFNRTAREYNNPIEKLRISETYKYDIVLVPMSKHQLGIGCFLFING